MKRIGETRARSGIIPALGRTPVVGANSLCFALDASNFSGCRWMRASGGDGAQEATSMTADMAMKRCFMQRL